MGSRATAAIRYLILELGDELPEIRDVSARALHQMGDAPIPALARTLDLTESQSALMGSSAASAAALLASYGIQALPNVVAKLAEPDRATVDAAGYVLVNMGVGADRAVPILRRRIERGEGRSTGAAAEVAGALAIRSVTMRTMLAERSCNARNQVRIHTLGALVQCGQACDPARVSALVRATSDKDSTVRQQVAGWFTERDSVAPKELMRPLARLLKDPSYIVADYAAWALQNAGNAGSVVRPEMIAAFARRDYTMYTSLYEPMKATDGIPDSLLQSQMHSDDASSREMAATY